MIPNFNPIKSCFSCLVWLVVLLCAAILILLVLTTNVRADDVPASVCWNGYQLEFTIPQSWLDTGSFSYVADGASLNGNTLTADALTNNESAPDVLLGQAAIFSPDGSQAIVGDANSPNCDGGGTDFPPQDVTLSGEPNSCYLGFLDGYLLTDDNEPNGIIWHTGDDGIIHIITGGGSQPDDPARYTVQQTDC